MARKKKYPVIRPWKITPEDEALFRVTDPTFEWMSRLRGKDLLPYSGKWVAAKDCKIIASADTYKDLHDLLDESDLQKIIIRHIDKPWTIRR